MGLDDRQPETPAQWMEHSDAWRYAHLDLAPSEYWRREALAAHQLAEQAQAAALAHGGEAPLWPAWLRLPRRGGRLNFASRRGRVA